MRVVLAAALLGLTACSTLLGVDFDRPSPAATTDATDPDAGASPDDADTDPASSDASVRPNGEDGGAADDAGVPDDDDGGPVVVPDSGPPLVNPVVCKPDADGDGYPAPGSKSVAFSNACPAGWTKYVTRKGDCDEANPNAHPGQAAFFGTPRANGSFDYDCNGTDEKDYAITACSLALPTECSLYVQGDVAAPCGQVQSFRYCVKGASGGCVAGPSTFSAATGCH